MFYINQQDYPDVPYRNNLNDPESRGATQGTVATSGCGICSMMMVIDRLTMGHPSLDEALDLSHSVGADRWVGTHMRIYGEACAERYGLRMSSSDDPTDLARCLERGGAGIVHVGGDYEGHIGVFSDVGHYVTAVSFADGKFCILDPCWRPDKYKIPGRKEYVRENGLFLYTDAATLISDTRTRTPGFFLFERA